LKSEADRRLTISRTAEVTYDRISPSKG